MYNKDKLNSTEFRFKDHNTGPSKSFMSSSLQVHLYRIQSIGVIDTVYLHGHCHLPGLV